MSGIEIAAVLAAAGAVAFALLVPKKTTRPATTRAAGSRPGRAALDAINEAKLEGAAAHIEDAIGKAHAKEFLASLASLAGEPKADAGPKS